MFESKDLLNDALSGAIYDRLCSVVYCALNTGLNTGFQEPEKLRKEWRELGAGALAHLIILSLSPDSPCLPNAIRFDPWIARHLRPYDERGLSHIVEQWLDCEPLAANISENPLEEDLKVKHLQKLLSAVNDRGKRTAGRIVS